MNDNKLQWNVKKPFFGRATGRTTACAYHVLASLQEGRGVTVLVLNNSCAENFMRILRGLSQEIQQTAPGQLTLNGVHAQIIIPGQQHYLRGVERDLVVDEAQAIPEDAFMEAVAATRRFFAAEDLGSGHIDVPENLSLNCLRCGQPLHNTWKEGSRPRIICEACEPLDTAE